MKAIYINKYGSADQLEYGDLKRPTPDTEELLVKVHASSVNPVDWKMREGLLKLVKGFKFPRQLGKDFAGEVVETGSEVTRFKKGDRIWGQLPGTSAGSYAEFVVAPDESVGAMPKNLDFKEAASIPLAALTALQSLRDKGAIKEGDEVLINGASGGVGTAAVQIAVALGAIVTGVCSEKNAEFVKSLGAAHVINYEVEDFTESRKKYDIICEFVGNASFGKCKNVLNQRGTYVTANPKPASLLGGFLSSVFSSKKQKIIFTKPSPEDLDFLSELVSEGKLKPIIDKTYKLRELAEAHQYSEKGHARGKIVIDVVG